MRGLVLLLALASAGTATEALRERDAEYRAAVPPGTHSLSESQRRRVEAIVVRIVDMRQILESALGARWATLTEEERKRLFEAFAGRFRRSTANHLFTMRDAGIDYRGERPSADFILVATRVTTPDETSEVTYVMRVTESGWRIVDIVIDDVSTVENYHVSFARIIKREGVEALIQRLERTSEASP
jgi:phospholipid transport system substrate-binding protein